MKFFNVLLLIVVCTCNNTARAVSAISAVLPWFVPQVQTPNKDSCPGFEVLQDTSTSKAICMKLLSPPCVVYSFGINYQWDFDDFMHGFGCEVHSFDPGMKYKSMRAEGHFFEPLGIGNMTGTYGGPSTLYSKKKGYPVETLQSIMQRLGHHYIDVLRLDVESAEWQVLENLPYEKIGQLSMELHMWHQSFEYYANILQQSIIKNKMKHVATFQNTDRINKRTLVPIYGEVTRVYEMTFIATEVNQINHALDLAVPKSSTDPALIHKYKAIVLDVVGIKAPLIFLWSSKAIIIVPHPETCPLYETVAPGRIFCYDEKSVLKADFLELKDACALISNGRWKKSFGWYLQQFLKLGAAIWIYDLSETYLLWDADNIPMFAEPLMTEDNRVIMHELAIAKPDINGYDSFAQELFGYTTRRTPHSKNFVTGFMIMKRSFVREMLREIDSHVSTLKGQNLTFPFSICATVRPAASDRISDIFWFSEYETYATWLFQRHPEAIAGTTRVIFPNRNPLWYRQHIAETNTCCISAASICQHSSNKSSSFFAIFEEHKFPKCTYREVKTAFMGRDSASPKMFRVIRNFSFMISYNIRV